MSLAEEIRDHSRQQAQRARSSARGVVLSVSPLKIELLGRAGHILGEDDIEMSQWVRTYHKQHKISKGDNAVLMEEDGDWTLHDIVNPEKKLPGKGEKGGTASLGKDGKVPTNQLPDAGTAFAAGLGLVLGSGVLDVGAGTGIIANTNDVAVDTTVIATRAYVDSQAALNQLIWGTE